MSTNSFLAPDDDLATTGLVSRIGGLVQPILAISG